ncbi:hypothetical protein R3P38DRAFT_2801754 [Favolaschia claudopus]|uniref:Uncharacterized protein n=1 Tax=Favolaschia claudopus TaxID=2862362 RepID=A0AAV9ZVV0_9AGAR
MALKRALIGRYHRRLELARRSLWEWIVVPNWCLKPRWFPLMAEYGCRHAGAQGGHRSFLWVGDNGSGARRCEEAGADRVEAHAARAARQLRHEHSGLGSSLHRTIEIHGRADGVISVGKGELRVEGGGSSDEGQKHDDRMRRRDCLPPLKHFPVSVTGVGSGGWLSRRVVRKLVGTIDVKKLGARGPGTANDKGKRGIRREARLSSGRNEKVMADDRGKLCGHGNGIRTNVDDGVDAVDMAKRCWGGGIDEAVSVKQGWLGRLSMAFVWTTLRQRKRRGESAATCKRGAKKNSERRRELAPVTCYSNSLNHASGMKAMFEKASEHLGAKIQNRIHRLTYSEHSGCTGVSGLLEIKSFRSAIRSREPHGPNQKASTNSISLKDLIFLMFCFKNKELLYIEVINFCVAPDSKTTLLDVSGPPHTTKQRTEEAMSDELRGLRRVENAFAVEKHVEVINAAGGRAVSPANRMAFGVTSRYLPSTRRVKMCKYGSSQSGGVEEIERTLRWEGDNDADTDCDEDGNEGDFKKVASDIARTCRTWWIARDSDGARRWFMGMGEGFVMADPDAAGYAQIEQTGMIDVGDVGAVGVGSEVVGDEGEDQASEFNGEWDEDGGEQRGSGRGWDWVECKCRWRRVMAGRMERHMMDRSPRQQATVVAGKRDAKFGSSWSCIELEDGLSKVEAGKGDANRENRMSECRHRHEERHAADGAWTAGKGEMVGGIGGESGKVTSGFLGARGGG